MEDKVIQQSFTFKNLDRMTAQTKKIAIGIQKRKWRVKEMEENGVNRITEITKRDILDLFQNGLEIDEFFQTQIVMFMNGEYISKKRISCLFHILNEMQRL